MDRSAVGEAAHGPRQELGESQINEGETRRSRKDSANKTCSETLPQRWAKAQLPFQKSISRLSMPDDSLRRRAIFQSQ